MKYLLQNIVLFLAFLAFYWGWAETFAINSPNTDVPHSSRLDLQFELPNLPQTNSKEEENSSENSQSEPSEKELEKDANSLSSSIYRLNYQNIIFQNRVFQNLQFILFRKSIYILHCVFRL
jgi:hypothetical protein